MTPASPMRAYLLRRAALVIPTLLGISFLAFLIASLAPGDPAVDFARRLSGGAVPTAAQVGFARRELGLNHPFALRYLLWVGNAVHGNLGTSYGTLRPVSLGFLMAGTVIIESIFAWPGVGQVALTAIHARDYPMIQGFVVYTGTLFVVLNVMVDVLVVKIDPRVRLGGAASAGAG